MEDYDVPFGVWLKRKLNERGLNQRRLAMMIGASTGMVGMWANDRRRPSPPYVLKIAQALGVPEEEVQVRVGYRQRRDTDMHPLRAEALEMLRQLPLEELPMVIDFMRWRAVEAVRPRPVAGPAREQAG